MSSYRRFSFHLLALAVISATFFIDLYFPMGSLSGGLYAFAVLMVSLGASRYWVVGMSVAGISLALVGALRVTIGQANLYECLTAVTYIILMFPFAWLNCVHRLEYSQQQRVFSRVEALGCETREIAHALSNVMQVVLGLSYMLQEDLDADDPRQNDLEVILTSVRDGSNLTERLSWLGHQVPRICPPGMSDDTVLKSGLHLRRMES